MASRARTPAAILPAVFGLLRSMAASSAAESSYPGQVSQNLVTCSADFCLSTNRPNWQISESARCGQGLAGSVSSERLSSLTASVDGFGVLHDHSAGLAPEYRDLAAERVGLARLARAPVSKLPAKSV